MMVYLARYTHQPRSEIRAMPLSTFLVWFFACEDMLHQEGTPDE